MDAEELFRKLSVAKEKQAELKIGETVYPPPVPPSTPTHSSKTDDTAYSGT